MPNPLRVISVLAISAFLMGLSEYYFNQSALTLNQVEEKLINLDLNPDPVSEEVPVFIKGTLTAKNPRLSDDLLIEDLDALLLQRYVEMYQYNSLGQENKDQYNSLEQASKDEYEEVWLPRAVNSSKYRGNYKNPFFDIPNDTQRVTDDLTLGKYSLSHSHVNYLSTKKMPIQDVSYRIKENL